MVVKYKNSRGLSPREREKVDNMKNVRKDVKEKLVKEYLTRKATNPQQGGYSYHTNKADHYLSVVDGVYYFTTIGYDGTKYYSVGL